MKKPFLIALVLLIPLFGCVGGGIDKKTNFRVVNAVPDADSLDFFVDFKGFVTDVSYLESSGYMEIEPGSHKTTVTAKGSFTPLVDTSVSLSDKIDYTLFVFGPLDNASFIFARDDNDPSSEQSAKIRVINAASQHKNIDIFIHSGGSSIEGTAPAVKGLSYKGTSKYLINEGGTYSITITDRRTGEVLAAKGGVNFSNEGVYSVIVSDSAVAGSIPKIVVLTDH